MEINPATREIGKSTNYRFEFALLLLTLFALPFFRIPHVGIPVAIDKSFLIIIVSALALIAWLVGRLASSNISLPNSKIIYALGLVWLSQLIASIFSINRGISFSGNLADSDSLLFTTVFLVITILFSLAYQALPRIALAYLALFISAMGLFVAQFVHVLTKSDLGGIFSGAGSSLIGGHYDLGIFFGLSLLVAMVFVEFASPTAFFRRFGFLIMILSALTLIFINFVLLWWVITLGSLLLMYLVYRSRARTVVIEGDSLGVNLKPRLARSSFAVVVLGVLCIVFGQPGAYVERFASSVMPSSVEARPSWLGTYDIAKSVIKENPIFGVGPGLFAREWVRSKSVSVNTTEYWSVDFLSGVGYIPSKVVTSGLVGILAWLYFLLVFAKKAVLSLKTFSNGAMDSTFYLAAAVASTYLWIMAVLYVPNTTIIVLTAAFTGIFIATLTQKGLVNDFVLSPSIYPGLKAISALLFVVIGLGALAIAYGAVSDYRAVGAYANSLEYTQNGDLEKGMEQIKKAISLDSRDLYYRHSSDVYLLSLVRSVSSLDPKSPEAAQIFVQLYGSAVTEAQSSTKEDPSNYLNYLKLGGVYESVVNLGIEGAYDQAMSAYVRASELNPTSPTPPFLLARLEVVNRNVQGAVVYLNRAVELKSNYAPAYMLASQIALGDGDLATAIKTTELGVLSDPNDFSSFFQLGYLRYQNGDYDLAVEALGRALSLNSGYANARYFLGLSYAKLGKRTEALLELEKVLESNPENEDVKQIIELINQGSTSFGRE